MKKILEVSVFLLVMFIAVGCGGSGSEVEPEPKDVMNPEMTITKPVEGATVIKGNSLDLSGTFTDDIELEGLIITLSFNQTKSSNGITDPWEPINNPELIALTGKEDEVTNHQLFEEYIPADCKGGQYLLTLELKDKAGKSISKQINIIIEG
ncbi:DUF4625 domain-containing protein [Carboxylicivirga sediminis]|uniref:DUF4625 domain-containing protein n=1 Tax=Carboxylicivirga sediminis TaxID=2006564 RepID=A0A941F592_9BACT|nr:DUF4625 domain-containing protein [Carboxylicivirga sediminis]MBR8536168.1 DUF4625 domain-containing protein [Carboxylicivirga sediminis]